MWIIAIAVVLSYKAYAEEIINLPVYTKPQEQKQELSNYNHKDIIGYCISKYSKKSGIPESIYYSIARVESGLNPRAINRNKNGTVDIGLMQVNSATARYYGYNPAELFDVCKNVEVATLKLSDCLNKWGYTLHAIGCYHSENLHYKVRYVKQFLKYYNKYNSF
jgi:soluble lytic murein transglycosylase-like protein